MKRITLFLAFLFAASFSHAQYDKGKLTNILTGGSSKTWSVQGVNINRPEKTMTFNINGNADVEKENGKKADKWSVSSKDNIRWFLSVGADQYEMVVSYSKNGSQYVKLTHGTSNDKYEMKLFPAK